MKTVVLLGLASAAAASTPPPTPVTLQEKFDRASADAAEGRCTDAIALFSTIERDPKVKPGSIAAASILIRKGVCLVRTGNAEAGEAMIRIGLPTLQKAGGFAGDVAQAWETIGDLAFNRYDYAAAADAYRRGLGHRPINRIPKRANA